MQRAPQMPEDAFEFDLEAMFAQAPAFADEDAFATRVEARLAKLRRTQRWVYGVAITAGALIAGLQLAQWQAPWRLLTEFGDGLMSLEVTLPYVTPTAAALATGGVLLVAYVTQLLREEA